MARNSRQEDKKSYFVLFSTSECIAWLKLFGRESVAIVMLNALKIIVYLKVLVRSFCKRSMYLVINQVVANMFVGSCEITRFCFLGKICKFWTINFLNFPCAIAFHAWCRCILLASAANLAAISLERMHTTLISSIQASSHQKENVWSSCCSRLDYIRALLNNRCLRCHPLCHYWRFKPQLFYLILAIFLVFPFNSSLL